MSGQIRAKHLEIYSSGKGLELVTNLAQPGKPLFNVKEIELFYLLSPNQCTKNGITQKGPKPEGFSNSSLKFKTDFHSDDI
ncbi:hypothetical protein GCM10007870_11700 [Gluconobacter kondonii]|uniref:Uncharacterized protein n=1 Tax=Gluconobacter kondonii TaxID=941463 RepID=A0ABQ5WQ56_9PROT|nr:hypothetical protein GCM10007870_11700 [Gluconobacter kondonii]